MKNQISNPAEFQVQKVAFMKNNHGKGTVWILIPMFAAILVMTVSFFLVKLGYL